MSHPVEPSDGSKPVVKEKDPHNYRKVGFAMIAISISLVLIGLLVWSIGSNYHFASDIMAGQEIDAMTPKTGFYLVAFDYTQPVGAKLKFLDHADNLDDAMKLQSQYSKQNTDPLHVQILVFTSFRENNTNSMALAEVLAMTPSDGFNIISDNTALPVGAKLSNLIHDSVSINATKDQQFEQDQLKADPAINVMIFSSSYDANLQQVLGKFNPDIVSKNPNKFIVPPPVAPAIPNANTTITQNVTTVSSSANQTAPVTNSTNAPNLTNATAVTSMASNQTASSQLGTNQEKIGVNATVVAVTPKNVSLSENVTINASSPVK